MVLWRIDIQIVAFSDTGWTFSGTGLFFSDTG